MTARQAALTSTTAVARPKTMAHSALPSLAASRLTAKQPKQTAASSASPMPAAAALLSPVRLAAPLGGPGDQHHADHGHDQPGALDGGQVVA